MDKSVVFTNPFGKGALNIYINKNSSILDIKKMILENLVIKIDNNLDQSLHSDNAMLPILYSPKVGLFHDDEEFGSIEQESQNLFCYFLPKNAYHSIADIRLKSGYSISDILFSVIINIGDLYYSVMLPRKTNGFMKSELRYFISDQLSNKHPKINFLDENLVLRNQRSGQKIFLSNVDFCELEGKTDIFALESINNGNDLLNKIVIKKIKSNTIDFEENQIELIKINPLKPLDVNGVRLDIVKSNIAFQDVDAVVNAANPNLIGGGGVDGAIHQMAGQELSESSRILSPCEPGSSILTPGFKLLSNWVIHTVGPIYRGGKNGENHILEQAYRTCMKIALRSKFQSIAVPAISTGIYGYPLEEATRIAINTISETLSESEGPSIKFIRFMVYDNKVHDVYQKIVEEIRT